MKKPPKRTRPDNAVLAKRKRARKKEEKKMRLAFFSAIKLVRWMNAGLNA